MKKTFYSKQISEFVTSETPFSKCGEDSVFFFEAGDRIEFEMHTGFDAVSMPYILHLRNCVLIPQAYCGARGEIKQPLTQKPWRHLPGRAMLTSDNRIIRDSFYRSGLAPPRLEPRANGQWIGNLPDPRSRIDDDCVLLDLITPHFGHMLLETPARHWPDIYDEFRDAYRDLKPIATRTHGLSLQRSEWPSYLTDFLESLQIKIHDIHFIDQPSSFRSLFVPSRISPYSSFGINRSYFDLLNRSSNWFKNNTGANSGGDCFSDRIYLSRSKLINGNRYLSNELIVEEIFSKHGFDIVHSQELDLGAQIEMINQATHIAGISGSQLHLCMYRSAPGLKLFRITPSDHNPPWDNMAARFTGTEVTTKSFSGSSRTNANDFSTWELSEEDLASLIETINSWCL